jgi:hypothetical protein
MAVHSRLGPLVRVAALLWCLGWLLLTHSAAAPAPAVSSNTVKYIQCVSAKGHIDHYYHFLYACAMPIAIYKNTNLTTSNAQLILCNSNVGGLKSILVDIFPKLKYADNCPPSAVVLQAYDHTFGAGIIELKNTSRALFIKEMYESAPPSLQPPQPIKILLIGRGDTSDDKDNEATKEVIAKGAHGSIAASLQTSGAQRRSIPNLQQLERSLRETFGSRNVVKAFLEDKRIHEQFYLFRSANLVIAQHGAALANIIFMHHGSRGVIEITPYNTTNYIGKFTRALPNCFRFAAFNVHVPYLSVMQADEFAPVKIREVVDAVKAMIRH